MSVNPNDIVYSKRNSEGTGFLEKSFQPNPWHFLICNTSGDLTMWSGSISGSNSPYDIAEISASWAIRAITSSYSPWDSESSASIVIQLGTKQPNLITGSTYPITSSWTINWNSSSLLEWINTNYQSILSTGSLLPVTSSWSQNSISASWAITASYISGSAFGVVPSSSIAISASYSPIEPVASASLVVQLGTKQPNLITGSTYPVTSSWATNVVNSNPGTGIDNYLPKWITNQLTDSSIYDDGMDVGIGTTIPQTRLHVQGDVSASNFIGIATTSSYLTASNSIVQTLSASQINFLGTNNSIQPSNDVRTWYYTGRTFSDIGEGSNSGIFFKPDGSKMFIIGTTTDSVRAFALSPAWDITTATYEGSASVVTQDATGMDFFFNPDGTRMFMVGSTNDRIYQYQLTDPWNILSLTYQTASSVVDKSTAPNGLYFSPDGTNMYVACQTLDVINRYILSIPWDLTSSLFTQSLSIVSQEATVTGITFNTSGSRLYVIGSSGDDINEYHLSEPWDITTAVYQNTSWRFVGEIYPSAIYYNDLINRAYYVGTDDDTVFELGTDYQPVLSGGSLTLDSQLYVEDQLQCRDTINVIGSAKFEGSLTAYSISVTDELSVTDAVHLGSTTSAITCNLGHGATASGSTKRINIGTGGAADSTTNITIGNSNSGSTIILGQSIDIFGRVSVSNQLAVGGGSNGYDLNASASGEIPIYDTFTEAGNTLLDAHTPDTGSAWAKAFSNGSATGQVFGGLGYLSPPTAYNSIGVMYINSQSLTNADYEVSVNFVAQGSADDTFWLIARYQDADNFYGVRWSTNATYADLRRKKDGVFTILGSINSATGSAVELKLRVIGNTLTVINGGVVRINFVDTGSAIMSPGLAGLAFGNLVSGGTDDTNTTWDIDDFKVQYYEGASSYIEKGRLGIGTTNPVSGTLHVEGNIYATSLTGSLLGTSSYAHILSGTYVAYAEPITMSAIGYLNVNIQGTDFKLLVAS